MGTERDLIQPGIARRGGVWATIESGTGAFALALRELLGPEAELFLVERDAGALAKQRRAFAARYPDTRIHYVEADYTQPLNDLAALDGILMANALHRVHFDQQERVLTSLCQHLKPGGRFILIEYERQQGTPWSRYPVSFDAFENLAAPAGLRDVRQLATIPASFFRDMYSAVGERA